MHLSIFYYLYRLNKNVYLMVVVPPLPVHLYFAWLEQLMSTGINSNFDFIIEHVIFIENLHERCNASDACTTDGYKSSSLLVTLIDLPITSSELILTKRVKRKIFKHSQIFDTHPF